MQRYSMGMNTLRPQELIEQRKITSDAKSNTNALTMEDSKKANPRDSAYRDSRDCKDAMNIKFLETQTDADYLIELWGNDND